MEVASLIISILAIVISVGVGWHQWRRNGWVLDCESAWEPFLSIHGEVIDHEPRMVVKAINKGRAPAQIRSFGFRRHEEVLAEFWGEPPDVTGPRLPYTLPGGHMTGWQCEFWFEENKGPIYPFIVLATGERKEAKKSIGLKPAKVVLK